MKQSTLLAVVLAAIVLTVHSSHAQDQVGAPKDLTPQIVKNAVGLVKEGKRYSLARTLEIGIPTHPFHHPFFYVTYRTVTAGSGGAIVFRDDVYGRDKRVVREMGRRRS